MDNGNIEKLAEARWRADWTTDDGEMSAVAPPFRNATKEHYVNDARKISAALTAAGLEVNKAGTREALRLAYDQAAQIEQAFDELHYEGTEDDYLSIYNPIAKIQVAAISAGALKSARTAASLTEEG